MLSEAKHLLLVSEILRHYVPQNDRLLSCIILEQRQLFIRFRRDLDGFAGS